VDEFCIPGENSKVSLGVASVGTKPSARIGFGVGEIPLLEREQRREMTYLKESRVNNTPQWPCRLSCHESLAGEKNQEEWLELSCVTPPFGRRRDAMRKLEL
jgi:hypothetical protein